GRGFDSLWLSERLTGDAPDPMVGLAFAAGRTRKLKLGTSVQVLPGRNPAVVAKEWASLDRLSRGRTLPAFGLGVANPAEQQAFGVARDERAAWFDEALPLVRRLWTEDDVDHDGPRFSYRALSVRPKPVQQPPDVWLGGRAKSELRRVGRLGDGWLPSFSTPRPSRSVRCRRIHRVVRDRGGRRVAPLAARDRLHGPAVPVGVVEEDERPPRKMLDVADLDAPRDQLGACGVDVGHHHLQAL